MKKCIVVGCIDKPDNMITGKNSFYFLNGDIEIDSNGNEVYITSRQKDGSSEFEDESILVKDMPKCVQEYIAKNKKFVEVNN